MKRTCVLQKFRKKRHAKSLSLRKKEFNEVTKFEKNLLTFFIVLFLSFIHFQMLMIVKVTPVRTMEPVRMALTAVSMDSLVGTVRQKVKQQHLKSSTLNLKIRLQFLQTIKLSERKENMATEKINLK